MAEPKDLKDIIDALDGTEVQKMAEQDNTTVTVDENGQEVKRGFQKTFENKEEAQVVIDTLEALGYGDNYDYNASKNDITIRITGLDERQIAVLQRKVNVNTWSSMTCNLANSVTNFATDVADYALNGALAPVVGSVANAGITTARVVGTAGVKAGAMVATSLIRNGRAAATEIYHSREIAECGNELKGLWSDISGHLFGSSGAKASSWTAF
jgi:hypothetical protein